MALQTVADASSFRTSEFNTRDSARATAAPGFRHFLGAPNPSQRFRAFGIDPLTSPEHLPKLRELMHRLSRRMDAEIHWPPHRSGSAEHWENPLIPSGYTYLLQFVAHDLVHSAIPLSVAAASAEGPRTRAARRFGWTRCMAAALSDRHTSMHSTHRTTTGAPSCGSGECAGRKMSPRPGARFAT